MKPLGWIFLGGYALDAVLSLIASYVPGPLFASNVISSVMILFTIVVFILAIFGKMAPRVVFLSLCGYYFFMLAFGFVVSIVLLAKLGPDKFLSVEVSPQFLRQQFDWLGPVHLTLLFVWLFLASYGLVSYARHKVRTEPLELGA